MASVAVGRKEGTTVAGRPTAGRSIGKTVLTDDELVGERNLAEREFFLDKGARPRPLHQVMHAANLLLTYIKLKVIRYYITGPIRLIHVSTNGKKGT